MLEPVLQLEQGYPVRLPAGCAAPRLPATCPLCGAPADPAGQAREATLWVCPNRSLFVGLTLGLAALLSLFYFAWPGPQLGRLPHGLSWSMVMLAVFPSAVYAWRERFPTIRGYHRRLRVPVRYCAAHRPRDPARFRRTALWAGVAAASAGIALILLFSPVGLTRDPAAGSREVPLPVLTGALLLFAGLLGAIHGMRVSRLGPGVWGTPAYAGTIFCRNATYAAGVERANPGAQQVSPRGRR